MTQIALIVKVLPQMRRSGTGRASSLHRALPRELTAELREGPLCQTLLRSTALLTRQKSR